jgi:sensor histidine kinase YesM
LTINIDADSDDDLALGSPISVVHILRSLLEKSVLLLIVFAIGAKILRRRTLETEARAVQAEALAEREALERQLAQARLQALQAQIEPHFLFNTLASVDFLIESDPGRASRMQKHLIQYLRSALPQMRSSQSNLGREFDLSRAYLEILKMRMEERLTLVFDVPDGLRSAEFPPMMLQSLVENAIAHGLEPSAEGGELRVLARVADGQLVVDVADTGIGLKAAEGASKGTGLGLRNIRERLLALYGVLGSFELSDIQPHGAVASLRIPYRTAKE